MGSPAVRAMLRHGADLESVICASKVENSPIRCAVGSNALHIAALTGNIIMAKLILEQQVGRVAGKMVGRGVLRARVWPLERHYGTATGRWRAQANLQPSAAHLPTTPFINRRRCCRNRRPQRQETFPGLELRSRTNAAGLKPGDYAQSARNPVLIHLLDERLPVTLLRQIWMNYSLEQSLPPRHQTLGKAVCVRALGTDAGVLGKQREAVDRS